MSGAKEIRSKIASIKKTQKITRAMEMVAASKMRRTQDRMIATRPYANKIRQVITHLAKSQSEYPHPLLTQREIKRVGVIVVSTDRGLCGGLNINLFKAVNQFIDTHSQQQIDTDLAVVGRKAKAFFKRHGSSEVVGSAENLGDTPKVGDIIGIVKLMLKAFTEEQIDGLYIASNSFVSTMVQRPFIRQLLPLPKDEAPANIDYHWDYLYEPDAKVLLDLLLSRYTEQQVYQSVIENIACEQASKMIAMKSASDNAGEITKHLQLAYNKARQSAITQELSEIVGGAEVI